LGVTTRPAGSYTRITSNEKRYNVREDVKNAYGSGCGLFKILFRHLLQGTKTIREIFRLKQPVSMSGLKLAISKTESYETNSIPMRVTVK
jgi:hypothetical protein